MKKVQHIIAFLLALLLFLSISWGLAWVLMPNRVNYGCMWGAYKKEERNSIDVLFFGSSMVYCDIVPSCIWEESGLRCYDVTGPEQTMPITYNYIREALRTQTPKLIMLDATEMYFKEYQRYTKANISYMPFGMNRIRATATAAEKEELGGLIFPLYNYHTRWETVKLDEIRKRLSPEADILAGYTYLSTAAPYTKEYDRTSSAETETYQENLEWLAKIKKCCDDKGVELKMFLNPSIGKIPAAALNTLRTDAAAMGLTVIDFNDNLSELGIDNDRDWYDTLHFNCRGAEKFSHWLGTYLPTLADAPERSAEEDAYWQERAEYFNNRCAEDKKV